MKLSHILETHQKFTTKNSLSDNLGDGFLLEHNLIYRHIRNAALKQGICFSSNRFHDYDVLPLSQLPKILSTKTIPYLPNVNALQEIEGAMPGVFQLNETPPLRANYILHESAHIVVRLLRVKFLGEASGKGIEAQRELALMIMMEEAFANAAESLMSAFSDSPTHDEFLARNAYIFERPATRKQMKTAMKIVGLEVLFRLVLLSFLFSNFQKEKVNASEFNRVLAITFGNDSKKRSTLSDRDLVILRGIFDGGFDLDPLFTTLTNSFCLRLMGISTPLKNLFAFDFLKPFEKNLKYQACLNALSGIIAGGKG